MKTLLEVINKGLLGGLNESNINLLADLDDDNLDQMGSLQTKSVNNNISAMPDSDNFIYAVDFLSNFKDETEKFKRILNNPRNFKLFKGIFKATDLDHLKKLIDVGKKLLGEDGNFNWIDTSNITDMYGLFYGDSTFNGHIELWNVSNVKNMRGMFSDAKSFNQPIGDWDVSNVTNMCGMFYWAGSFNQPIGDWDVSNVGGMTQMFQGAKSFNQDLTRWKTYYTSITGLMFNDCPIKEEYKPKGI